MRQFQTTQLTQSLAQFGLIVIDAHCVLHFLFVSIRASKTLKPNDGLFFFTPRKFICSFFSTRKENKKSTMRTVALCQNKKLVLLKSNYFTLTSDVTIYRNEEEITCSLFTMEKDFFFCCCN